MSNWRQIYASFLVAISWTPFATADEIIFQATFPVLIKDDDLDEKILISRNTNSDPGTYRIEIGLGSTRAITCAALRPGKSTAIFECPGEEKEGKQHSKGILHANSLYPSKKYSIAQMLAVEGADQSLIVFDIDKRGFVKSFELYPFYKQSNSVSSDKVVFRGSFPKVADSQAEMDREITITRKQDRYDTKYRMHLSLAEQKASTCVSVPSYHTVGADRRSAKRIEPCQPYWRNGIVNSPVNQKYAAKAGDGSVIVINIEPRGFATSFDIYVPYKVLPLFRSVPRLYDMAFGQEIPELAGKKSSRRLQYDGE